ncbi:MAG TPA: TlpA disulfide reductase family protein [Opitutaceae bacterium]|nr:TlpA disulfide reductase family protein [Opitutaceae bacterium]HND61954.1 TlpA disulfide reductase family protein [Opitutaceae bacterium]
MSARILSGLRVALVGVMLALSVHAGSGRSAWKEIDGLVRTTADLMRERNRDELFNNLNLLKFRLDDFIAQYPQDDHRWNAELLKLHTAAQLATLKGTPVDWSEQEDGFAYVMSATGAKRDVKVAARAAWFHARLMQVPPARGAEPLRALAREVQQFYEENRSSATAAQAAMEVAEAASRADPERAEAILQRVAQAGDGEIPKEAASRLQILQASHAPMKLQFTALDGTKVDLAALRGKVVLIDFWATWCPPCRDETPTIVETYRRLHDKGFEIVGISLDESRTALRDYLKANSMTWPQFFDGGGWDNRLAEQYGIHSIPAMWLVNRRGYLVDVQARDDLADKVEKLLAEPAVKN